MKYLQLSIFYSICLTLTKPDPLDIININLNIPYEKPDSFQGSRRKEISVYTMYDYQDSCVKEDNVAYWGQSLNNMITRNGEGECAYWCGKNDNCKFWVLQKSNNLCLLKTHKYDRRDNEAYISGSKECTKETPSAVNREWGEWNEWGTCSQTYKTCGGGRRQRERRCNSPSLSSGESGCRGRSTDNKQCNTHKCGYGYQEYEDEEADSSQEYPESADISVPTKATGFGFGSSSGSSKIPHEPPYGQRCSGRNYGERRCCSPQNPCNEGEGDCDGPDDGGQHDGHAGCKGSLICGSSNCKKFGTYYHEKDDCCEKPVCPSTGDPSGFDGWSSWGSWNQCDKKCGKGRQSRHGSCSGRNCKQTQERNCNITPCNIIHGFWLNPQL